MPRTRNSARRPPRGATLLQSADFTAYLREKADQIAPGDLDAVLAQAADLQRRADAESTRHPRVPRQVTLALEIIREHVEGRCPQIPYHTIALLAVALLYFSTPLDVIPDWIAGIGKADDALVMELAFVLGRAGVERYCQWKELPTEGILSAPSEAAPARARRPATRRRS